MGINQHVPWWGKMAAKVALSRVPVGYGVWERLHLFKHGAMEQPLYALAVFRKHFERSGLAGRPGGFSVLEIGPGDTLSTAVIATALGAGRCWLVDAGAFARTDVQPYRDLVDSLRANGLQVHGLDAFATRDALLAACHATYLTHGAASLADIPDASVDFVFSHAVLEHIRRADFERLAREMRRVLKPGGVASHQVDLRDHLDGHLNNLRFSDGVWESGFMAHSGFYTNRIRFHEMLEYFRAAGFDCDVMGTGQFDVLRPARSAMVEPYRGMPEAELMVSDFDIVLH